MPNYWQKVLRKVHWSQPLMKGMKDGKLVRIEELTRISADVQDTLITGVVRKNDAHTRIEHGSAGSQRI